MTRVRSISRPLAPLKAWFPWPAHRGAFLPMLWLVLSAFVASGWPTSAQALSVGRLRASPVIGQPLDVALPVALDEGEPFGPECVGA